MRRDIIERKAEILEWISANRPKAWMARELKCKIDTLDSYLKKMNIVYKGNMGAKSHKKSPNKKSALELISSGSLVSSSRLRQRLIEDGIKSYKCEICFNTEWNNEPIPLELDHVDGNHYNNDLSNLRILCPNCHAQTPTNSGRNKGKIKF